MRYEAVSIHINHISLMPQSYPLLTTKDKCMAISFDTGTLFKRILSMDTL